MNIKHWASAIGFVRVSFFVILLVLLACKSGYIEEDVAKVPIKISARYAPQEGKVLVFVGQDNASVGGNAPYVDGYVDKVGQPAGITHYVYMAEGWTNSFGHTFDIGHVDGLYTETNWAAGPMCMKCYLDAPAFSDTIVHLSISMEGNSEDKVADGSYDYLIDELAEFLKDYHKYPFLIRIGYEFDGFWNNYDAENFKLAFRRIVDHLRSAGVNNFATVMAASSPTVSLDTWNKYYPGDDYVDWVGYSYWGGNFKTGGSLEFARTHHKPVFVAESAPRGFFLGKLDGEIAWQEWYVGYIQHIKDNFDVIRAISYINCNWEAQPMWVVGQWGDTRIEVNEIILHNWLKAMKDPIFINGGTDVYDLIGFTR